MNDEPKIDLSPLEPSADGAHWERMVRSVAARGVRAVVARLRPHPILVQLAAWSRPVFAAAAVVSFAWAPVLALTRSRSATPRQPEVATQAQGLDTAMVQWAMNDHVPTAAELLETLSGDGHARATP